MTSQVEVTRDEVAFRGRGDSKSLVLSAATGACESDFAREMLFVTTERAWGMVAEDLDSMAMPSMFDPEERTNVMKAPQAAVQAERCREEDLADQQVAAEEKARLHMEVAGDEVAFRGHAFPEEKARLNM